MATSDRIPLISLTEVAEWLDVSDDLVYRLCRSGRLPGVKVGGLWRFRKTDVDQYLDRQLEGQFREGHMQMQ